MAAPTHYECRDCGVTGVRLWRDYSMFLSHIELRCRPCACFDQKKDPGEPRETDQIGWLVPAVPYPPPDEDWKLPKDYTFWGYSSVPQAGMDWWSSLP